jgi:Kdo2-lipid IVA lauroyltransferase/acyltransferase
MTALRHRAEAAVAASLLWLVGRLSPTAASNLGGFVARAIGPWLPVSRVAYRNLELALPELDHAARRRIVRGVWDNLGRTACELPHVASLRQNTPSGPGWEMVGEEHLVALAERGGPAIFFSGHIANWEMLPPAVAAYGMVFSSMYRGAKNPLIDRMLIRLRHKALGAEVPQFAKGAAGARAALAHVNRGGFLGMLMDQKMNDGIPARLFGREAMTAPALAAIALRLRCPVIPGHVERIGPARFRLVCEAPMDLPDSGDRQADVAAVTQRVNDWLERWIRARPEEWLWVHRRWGREVYER